VHDLQDFALGDSSKRPGVPLQLDVSTDKSDNICGDVPVGSSGSVLVYPVKNRLGSRI
jgi:hypothetical protein